MADVELAYVFDFGGSEEYFARRGAGATLDDRPLVAEGPGYGLEVVGIESAKPERTIPLLEALAGKAYRMRAVGSIAISLAYVAGGTFASRIDYDLFLEQGREFQENYEKKALDKFWANIINAGLSHPFPVWRVAEILSWVESGQYAELMAK